MLQPPRDSVMHIRTQGSQSYSVHCCVGAGGKTNATSRLIGSRGFLHFGLEIPDQSSVYERLSSPQEKSQRDAGSVQLDPSKEILSDQNPSHVPLWPGPYVSKSNHRRSIPPGAISLDPGRRIPQVGAGSIRGSSMEIHFDFAFISVPHFAMTGIVAG